VQSTKLVGGKEHVVASLLDDDVAALLNTLMFGVGHHRSLTQGGLLCTLFLGSGCVGNGRVESVYAQQRGTTSNITIQ
jgi:hypothetical protein